jgi:hypothetical protein
VGHRPAHAAQPEAELDADIGEPREAAPQHSHDIFAKAAVGRVPDVGLDHRRVPRRGLPRVVDAHPAPGGHLLLDCDFDDVVEHLAQHRRIEELSQPHHGLRVGHLAAIDAAEAPVHETAVHLALELVVAPLPQVLERQHPQHHLGRRAAATATRTLREAAPQHAKDFVDQRLVFEQHVDLP